MKKSIIDVKKIISKYILIIIYILFLEIVSIFCSIIIPYILGDVIHKMEIKQIELTYIINRFFIVILLYALWDISSAFTDYKFQYVNKKIQNDVRKKCFSTIFNSNLRTIINKSEGEIISKVINDTENLEKSFSSFFNLVISLIQSIALLIIMLRVSSLLSYFIIALFISILAIQKLSSSPLKKLNLKYRESEEKLLIDFKNLLVNIFVVKLFSLEGTAIDFLENRNYVNLKNHVQVNKKISIIKYLNFFISSIFRVSSVFIGGILYYFNKISIGSIFSMYSYSIQLTTQLRTIIETDIILKNISSSYFRIENFLKQFENSENLINCDVKIEDIKKIEFKEVSFKYEDKCIIENLSFIANRNQVIGIIGENGAGKTTLAYLICGVYRVQGIFYNDIPANKVNEKALLDQLTYVFQDIKLFPATIIENITCFNKGSIEEAYAISKKIGLHEKIMRLPDGYNTLVNEKNLNLSGGEKQLISIARALLKKSNIMILDEMNSSLDLQTENVLIENIQEFFKDRVVFIISHRKKILDICDYIIELKKR